MRAQFHLANKLPGSLIGGICIIKSDTKRPLVFSDMRISSCVLSLKDKALRVGFIPLVLHPLHSFFRRDTVLSNVWQRFVTMKRLACCRGHVVCFGEKSRNFPGTFMEALNSSKS